MTLASSIISDAYRESNLIAASGSPTTTEAAEGLRRLNGIILSTMGSEVGGELTNINIGGTYDESDRVSSYVPDNSRLTLNLAASRTIYLHPAPRDGQRVAVADSGANLATYNLILNGNGQRIETAASVTLSTNSLARQWMYRADTGNWVRVTELASGDEMPFPVDFDDYFITMLAMRLNPRHGKGTSEETGLALDRWRSQIRARYRKPRPPQDSGALGLLGSSTGSDSGLL